MKPILEYIIKDCVYNIIDSDELRVFNQETFKLWSDLGFTQGLSDEAATICSNAFDAMVRYLLHYDDKTKVDVSDFELITQGGSTYAEINRDFTSIAFPMIRWLYSCGVVVEPKKLNELYNKWSPSIFEKCKHMRDIGLKIDVEAEAVFQVCNIIAKKVYKNKRKR